MQYFSQVYCQPKQNWNLLLRIKEDYILNRELETLPYFSLHTLQSQAQLICLQFHKSIPCFITISTSLVLRLHHFSPTLL